jgi:hypothetical protein
MLESKSPDFEAPTTGVVDSGIASVFLFNYPGQAEGLVYFFL